MGRKTIKLTLIRSHRLHIRLLRTAHSWERSMFMNLMRRCHTVSIHSALVPPKVELSFSRYYPWKSRIDACGSHEFRVFVPLNSLCTSHKTLKESNLLSGKETEDDVNFNPRISSGHRPMADFEAIREKTTNGWADGWADGRTDEQSYL